MIVISQESHAPTCVLSTWVVADTKRLVDALAWLYLRKPSHAARIIGELAPGSAGFPGRVFDNAIDLLRYNVSDIAADLASADPSVVEAAEKKRDIRIVHRDGLLFQYVSWVAANIQFPTAHATAPHVRKADKGFDGLLLEVSPTGISRLILCEDKASTSPRGLVTGSIWPDIIEISDGERDLEILDGVTALLDSLKDVDRESILVKASWERAREYRVALTVEPKLQKEGSYVHLFDGFDGCATGNLNVRMAEVMPLSDIRAYLQSLADQVVKKLQAMAAGNV